MRNAAVLFAVATAVTAIARAQDRPDATAFDVASIKPDPSGAADVSFGTRPGGTYSATNVPLRLLVVSAYKLRPNQVVGGPQWIDSERFDVLARGVPSASPEQVLAMLQVLLRERFKLVAHTDSREQPVYDLALARPNGRFGPRLARSSGAATSINASIAGRSGGTIKGAGRTIADLCGVLGRNVDRPVIDRTGLSGSFDFELEWAADPLRASGAADDSDLATIFTALREQLGLKLEPARAPVDVLVIDGAERPSSN